MQRVLPAIGPAGVVNLIALAERLIRTRARLLLSPGIYETTPMNESTLAISRRRWA
jgi:hypothetical protein